MPDFASVTRPLVEAALESGETLEGVCAATQQSTSKGGSQGIEALAGWFQRFARKD